MASRRPVPPRVVVVASHPIQHFCPLYKALAADGRVALTVLFASRDGANGYFDPGFNTVVQWSGGLLDGYAHEFLPGSEDTRVAGSVDNEHIRDRLDELDPDVVQVYGFWHRISRRAISWAKGKGKGVLLVSDSELRSRRSLLTRIRKRLTVPYFLSLADGYLTIGDCNEAYYRAYGAREEQFFRTPYPIDDLALESAFRNRQQCRSDVRGLFGIPEQAIVALVVGKLTPRKSPGHVIAALAVAKRNSAARELHVLFAGDGPLRDSLEASARSAAHGAVHFAGFVNTDRLPAIYAACDFLVHPSSEDPHPLATSEAVYGGLPVIVSDRVGSVGPTDDVRLGVNGMQYRFGEISQLTKMMIALTDVGKRESMAAASRSIGQGRTLRASVDGFVRGVLAVVSSEDRKSLRSGGR